MQLLQDTFIIENLQVLNEGASTGPMRIKGVFGRCNEKNNNGRIYPTNILESQLNKVQPLIAERRLCGELDHPQNDTVKLSNASHLITKLEMKGDELIGEAELLRTPAGLTAQALINGGVKIGISSRGMGTLSEDREGNKIVNEDFRLVTFDLVADPSTRGAFPGLSESTESRFITDTQNKLEKECNFVTLMEAKLRESYGINEAWEDEDSEEDSEEELENRLDRKINRQKTAGSNVSNEGPGFFARQRIKAGKRAEAIGDVQAERIRARGAAGGNVGAFSRIPVLGRLGSGSSAYQARTERMNQDAQKKRKAELQAATDRGKTQGTAETLRTQRLKRRAEIQNALGSRRRNLKTGSFRGKSTKNFKSPQAHAASLNAGTEYRQIGKVLAESFGLIGENQAETDVRDARRDAASREIARRGDLHLKRTGQYPRRDSRLNKEGKPQPGKRTSKKYRDPSEPSRP